tara:strand:+ start:2594 stop:2728 length:135 start_codon:yes stop_codon:yes gene_type:complete
MNILTESDSFFSDMLHDPDESYLCNNGDLGDKMEEQEENLLQEY